MNIADNIELERAMRRLARAVWWLALRTAAGLPPGKGARPRAVVIEHNPALRVGRRAGGRP